LLMLIFLGYLTEFRVEGVGFEPTNPLGTGFHMSR
jgi:hypothetical protein